MRKYDQKALDILKNQTTVIQNYGLDIIVKPSPGEERPGYLDPVEYALMAGHWAGSIGEEGAPGAIPQEMPPKEVFAAAMRENMGFPNYNLNTVEIHTKYEELTGSGNIVGLWRYYPRKTERTGLRPAMVFFHGGGWIGGSVYTVENCCKLIAELADAVVFNVDYSLAPEKPYPNGLNDNYYAVKHISENAEAYGIDPDKIVVGGDSAGGNYTAAVCLKARDEKTPNIAGQVLIYPCVAMSDAKADGYEWEESVFEMSAEHEPILKNMIALGKPAPQGADPMAAMYIPDPQLAYDPYVSPMLAETHSDLPKALLIDAEFDGLRIQTEFYAKQLSDAGVDVKCIRYKGMTHAFLDKLGHTAQTEDMCIEIADFIKSFE